MNNTRKLLWHGNRMGEYETIILRSVTQFSILHLIPLLLNIMFARNFLPNVYKLCYKHVLVFTHK